MPTTVVNIRDHKAWEAEGGVYIGRRTRTLKGSRFANPFTIGRDGDRQQVIVKYKAWFYAHIISYPNDNYFCEDVEKLRGKMLVCWCFPERCHGEIIVEYLEGKDDG